MKRREFLAGTALAAAGLAVSSRIVFAQDGAVEVIINSDQLVLEFWTNVVVPAVQEQYPDMVINVTSSDGNSSAMALAERALAALKSGTDPQVDFLEAFNPRNVNGAIETGLWTDFTTAGLTNFDKISKIALDTEFGLPYRGSQVLLAYDADKVTSVPKTWEDLVAWIKANPGQFIYNRPDKGGAGGNFIRRAIHEVNGRDPSVFTSTNFSQAKADETLPDAWALLADLAPALYEGGAYTAGNTQSLQLLSQGVVSMVPAWSDQALSSLKSGELAPNIKLTQLTDLAFCGGFAYCSIPVNGAHQESALKLADVLISPAVQEQIIDRLAGFPALDWSNLSPELRAANADIIPASIPSFPEGDWEAAINDGWYRNVAPQVTRD